MSMYCQPNDLTSVGVNPLALQDVTLAEQQAACATASAMLDDYFGGRYQLPLLAWPPSVTYRAAQIAVYLLLKARGMNPDAGADKQLKEMYDEAIAWAQSVQRQATHPQVTPSLASPGNPTYDLPQVQTSQQRGWLTSNSNGTPTVGW